MHTGSNNYCDKQIIQNMYIINTNISIQQRVFPFAVSSMFSNTTGGDRHRETQLQLQRKLHEREHVSRQKKKLQQMKEDNANKQRQERQTPLITSPTGQQVCIISLILYIWGVFVCHKICENGKKSVTFLICNLKSFL